MNPAAGRAGEWGVTLLELLVVLMLIAVVTSIVMPMVASGPSPAELRSAARQVAAGARMARTVAVTQRRAVLLQFDIENGTFKVDGEPRAHVLPRGIAMSLYTAQRDVVNAKVGAIRFYPDGGSNGGRVSLVVGERRFDIDVDWLTGRVAILG